MHCAFQHKSRLPDIDLNCSIYFNLFLSKIQEVNYMSREVSLQSSFESTTLTNQGELAKK